MKVQKIVSLDVESVKQIEEQNIENFSGFVRDCLKNCVKYIDINKEILTRVKWKHTADFLAQTILEIYKELGIEHNKTRDEIVMDAFQQTRIEDYL